MDDDGTGWDAVLLDVWSTRVRDAVVERIQRSTVGHRGWVARALIDPEASRPGWTETLHALVLAAIKDETGADLELLGSQAAWECYEQVWLELTARWQAGGGLAVVPLRTEPEIVELVSSLPAEVAAHAAADVTGPVPDPLWIHGRLHVDLEGLLAYRRHAGELPHDVGRTIDRIVAHVHSA